MKHDKFQLFAPGELRRLLILGLDRRTVSLCRFARDMGIAVAVVAGSRQLEQTLADGELAAKAVNKFGVEILVRDILSADDPVLAPNDNTLVFSLSSPFIIHSWLIDRFQGRVVNSHGTRLPEWRGGGTYSWQIMAGDRRGNSLAHLVTPRIDDGAVIEEREYGFPDNLRRPIEYMNYATSMDHEFLAAFLTKVSQGVSFSLRFQDEAVATYFPRLNSGRQGFIDWTWHGDAIERFILAFSTPYPGAKTRVREKEVHIFDAHFLRDQGPQHPFLFGLIVRSFDSRLRVLVNGGQLDIALADTEGMQDARVGDRLHTPRTLLDEALVLRPVYTAAGLKE